MRVKCFLVSFAVAVLGVAAYAQQPASGQNGGKAGGQDTGTWQGKRGRGMGGFPGGGRGVLGSVTEVAADRYTIKTDSGETYIVHFSVNTRIMKQPAEQGGGRRQSAAGAGAEDEEAAERVQPQTIKPGEIKVGDFITAGGEVDASEKSGKSIGAVFIFQVSPERARQMREMQANFGKTWLAGRVMAIEDTTITIEGMVDRAPHKIAVDENTSFRKRRESITLADIQPGQQLRAEGGLRGGVFLATSVIAMQPQNREDRREDGQDGAPGLGGAIAPPQ